MQAAKAGLSLRICSAATLCTTLLSCQEMGHYCFGDKQALSNLDLKPASQEGIRIDTVHLVKNPWLGVRVAV